MAYHPPKLRRQRPFKGGRTPATGGFTPKLMKWVEKEAARFNCSKSFVLATCVGLVSGIDAENYTMPLEKVVMVDDEDAPPPRTAPGRFGRSAAGRRISLTM